MLGPSLSKGLPVTYIANVLYYHNLIFISFRLIFNNINTVSLNSEGPPNRTDANTHQ